MTDTRPGEEPTLAAIRRFALMLFVVGVIGTGLELVLLGHTEDPSQWVPLVLMALGLVVLGWRLVAGGARSLRVFRATMVMFVVGGGVGLWMHYQGNAEFELEMYPSLQGPELVWESMTGATPALAPGTLSGLGLLGLLHTYRHPTLVNRAGLRSARPEDRE